MNSYFSRFLPVAIRTLLILLPFSGGCSSPQKQVPSIDVFGSYFPAWLLSLAAGIVLTGVAAGVGRLIDIRLSGFQGFVVAVSLILIFSISVWFWFFAR